MDCDRQVIKKSLAVGDRWLSFVTGTLNFGILVEAWFKQDPFPYSLISVTLKSEHFSFHKLEASMSIHSEQIPFVVVQGPSFRDIDFASRWLTAAVDGDRILACHRSTSPEFENDIKGVGHQHCRILLGCNGVHLPLARQLACVLFRSIFVRMVRGLRIHDRDRLFHTDRSTLSNDPASRAYV